LVGATDNTIGRGDHGRVFRYEPGGATVVPIAHRIMVAKGAAPARSTATVLSFRPRFEIAARSPSTFAMTGRRRHLALGYRRPDEVNRSYQQPALTA